MSDPLPDYIGPYRIQKLIGRGGMGEVFLAVDPGFQRLVAVKRIRNEYKAKNAARRRFLNEASIAGQLNHPSIVPIFALCEDADNLYYVMPYVEGKTLKDLLIEATKKPNSTPIGHFARIFLSICQAIAFAHKKGYVHRDIKPENILVGELGQVQILDWGLVKAKDAPEDSGLESIETAPDATLPGKIVGTLAYMAPELALGHPSSVESDIYSLGVILYQMLALKFPFKRGSLKEFKQQIPHERFPDPSRRAPWRDIPPELVRIARKCLYKQPSKRYSSASGIVDDLVAYLEGRSRWFAKARLEIDQPKHWLFQEHLLLPEHPFISRGTEGAEWVEMMASKPSFTGNIRIIAKVRLNAQCTGMGLLLGLPTDQPHDGFCLWLQPALLGPCCLLRATAELAEVADFELRPDTDYSIIFERIDNVISLYIDGKAKLTYTAYMPTPTTGHVGLLFKDRSFHIDPILVFVGSLNVSVSCLSIPDAFLAHRQWDLALIEYRRIAAAFAGRAEGREALFRAGITLLEQARGSAQKSVQLELARREFERLAETAAQPLEYLGKALICQEEGDSEEEAKCLQIAFRKWPGHPLLPALEEHLLLRLYESTRKDRTAAFRFMLVALLELPALLERKRTALLIERLQKSMESLPFLSGHLGIALAFWLGKRGVLRQFDDPSALPCLLRLGEPVELQDPLYSMDEALDAENFAAFDKAAARFTAQTQEERIELDIRLVWKALLQKEPLKAREILDRYPSAFLNHEINLLHFLYGCLLLQEEGEGIGKAHLSGIFDTPFPRTWQLATHMLFGNLKEWLKSALFWEKKQLYRQLVLFYHCLGDFSKKREALESLKAVNESVE